MNTVKSFLKQFEAILKGDNAAALAQKALRQADSALKTHIAIYNGQLIKFEDAVEKAKEAQVKARVNNGKLIEDNDTYVESLLKAKNNVTYAEEALTTHQEKIEFLESQLASLGEEVPVEEKA